MKRVTGYDTQSNKAGNTWRSESVNNDPERERESSEKEGNAPPA
jgi:hypothetical protein